MTLAANGMWQAVCQCACRKPHANGWHDACRVKNRANHVRLLA